jgi:hypothetical protein
MTHDQILALASFATLAFAVGATQAMRLSVGAVAKRRAALTEPPPRLSAPPVYFGWEGRMAKPLAFIWSGEHRALDDRRLDRQVVVARVCMVLAAVGLAGIIVLLGTKVGTVAIRR